MVGNGISRIMDKKGKWLRCVMWEGVRVGLHNKALVGKKFNLKFMVGGPWPRLWVKMTSLRFCRTKYTCELYSSYGQTPVYYSATDVSIRAMKSRGHRPLILMRWHGLVWIITFLSCLLNWNSQTYWKYSTTFLLRWFREVLLLVLKILVMHVYPPRLGSFTIFSAIALSLSLSLSPLLFQGWVDDMNHMWVSLISLDLGKDLMWGYFFCVILQLFATQISHDWNPGLTRSRALFSLL